MTKSQTLREILDEVYMEIPLDMMGEEDVDNMYKDYQAFLKEQELINLDHDFDQG